MRACETQAEVDQRNRETSAQECRKWLSNPPNRYVAYVNGNLLIVTTWTGEKLGEITHRGEPYRTGFRSYRQSIRVTGTNGVRYYGTYYMSSGNYCRLYRMKGGK